MPLLLNNMPTPNYKELLAILILGMLQPIIEIAAGAAVAGVYNVFAAGIVLIYVLYRLYGQPTIRKEWGLRLDNVIKSLPSYLLFTCLASVLLYMYGNFLGRTPLPRSFWYLVALYPIWGIAQQFALQNLVTRNLVGIFPTVTMRALVTAAIFSLSHAPSYPLMILTALAGFCFTLLYQRSPNLIVLGISHGFLGALAFYLVVGQDQWAILQQFLY